MLAGVEDGGDGVPFLDCLEDAMENGGLAALEDKGHGVRARDRSCLHVTVTVTMRQVDRDHASR